MKLLGKMFQNRIQRIVSVIAAFSILLSALFTGVSLVNAQAETTQGGNVLRYNTNTAGATFFGQNVVLEAGKKYSYSYYYAPGKLVTSKILDGNDYEGIGGASITVTNTKYDDEYNKVTYEFIAPANATSAGEGKVRIYLGFAQKTSGENYYIYGFDVHAVDDETKTNLFKDPYLTENETLRTSDGYPGNWYKPYSVTDKGATLNSDRFYVETLESLGGMDFFKKTDADRYVLKLEPNTLNQPYFGQTVSLEAGKTYVYSNYFLPGTDANLKVCYADQTLVDSQTIYGNDWSKQSLKFTVPADAPDDGNGKKRIYVGFRGHKNANYLYYYGFELYDVENPDVNLLSDSALVESPTPKDSVVWKSPSGAAINANYSRVTLESIGGMDIFKKTDADRYVLKKGTNSSAAYTFGQKVALEEGKTYIFSNYYKGTYNYQEVVYGDGSFTRLSTQSSEDNDWFNGTLKFTVPESAPDDGNGKKSIWVGIVGYAAPSEIAYFYDFRLYDIENPELNLLADNAFIEGETDFNKDIWKSAYNTTINSSFSKATLEAAGGMDIFKKSDADRYALKLEPETTGQPVFGQTVSLKAGKTYEFSNYYLPGTAPVHWMCDGGNIDAEITFEATEDDEWSKQTAKFTVPTTAPDDPDISGNKLVWVGFRGHKNSNHLYYYGLKLCDTENPEVNLLRDSALIENGTSINGNVWKAPSGSAVSAKFSKVKLDTIGGMDIFRKTYALKLAPNSKGQPVFGQTVSLEAGKTYEFSNYYLPGTDSILWICDGNNFDNAIAFSTTDDNEWSKQTAKFTVPDSAPDDPEVSGNKLVWVGFRGHYNANNLYYYGFKLCDTANPDVNLLKDPVFTENGASINGDVWKAPSGSAISANYSKVLLASIGGINTFKITDATEPMVLKLAPNSTGQPYFGQWVSLKKGETYVFSNCYLPGTELYQRVYLANSADYDKSHIECETVYDTEWSKQGIKFTVPTTAADDGNGNTLIWVGLRGYKYDGDLYYYDFGLYNVNDPTVNLLADGDILENGTSINNSVWISPWNTAIKTTFSKVTLASIGGADVFKKSTASEPMAIRLDAETSGMPWFGQWVTLEKGKTYVLSNYYLPGTDLNHRIYYYHSDGSGYDLSDIVGEDLGDDADWSKRGTKFTVPNDAPDDGNGKVRIWVGIRGYKYSQYLYYYGFELYDVDNPDVNLLDDADLLEDGTILNRAVWQTPGGAVSAKYSKVTLSSIGGIDVFKKIKAEEPMVLALAPETTGQPFFGQWVTLEIGKTYIFSNCYIPGTDTIQKVYLDSNENTIEDYDVIYDKEWSKKGMKFTVPANATDIGSGKTLLWVGIRGYKYDGYLYFYNFELYDVENPNVNLMQDSTLQENGTQINTTLWKSPYNSAIKNTFAKVTLSSVGGADAFKRTGDVGPKMMYYTRTSRGPDHETYGCFSFSIPEKLRVAGQNYVLEFDARSITGGGLTNFRCGAIASELALDENNTIAPASIEGYKYKFNLRFTDNMEKKMTFMIFVPEGVEGYLSNLYIYEADSNFNKVSDRDLFQSSYADFSRHEVGNYVEFYTKQGGCIGTETGRLESVPEHFFELPPAVPVPAGDKMMSYASVWGAGTIIIDLPHTAEKGSVNGKNYIISLDIRPTEGRDPAKFYSTGVNGEHVQVYPASVDGYKYTFNLTERYNFSLILEFPANCEGYISYLEMYEADDDFKQVGTENLATAFGKGGKFAKITMQQGFKWEGIEFTGGFVNTFVDTWTLAKELKNGTLGEYHSSGGIWPIPANYFVVDEDDDWADDYIDEGVVETGTIKGILIDSYGKTLSGYTILLKSMQDPTNVRRAVSDKNGEFAFDDVAVGGYEVSILANGSYEIMGDMFVWVEEKDDLVSLALMYTGESLSVSSPENPDSVVETLPEDNNAGSSQKDDNTQASSSETDNTLQIVLIILGIVIFLIAIGIALFIILRSKKKRNSEAK